MRVRCRFLGRVLWESPAAFISLTYQSSPLKCIASRLRGPQSLWSQLCFEKGIHIRCRLSRLMEDIGIVRDVSRFSPVYCNEWTRVGKALRTFFNQSQKRLTHFTLYLISISSQLYLNILTTFQMDSITLPQIGAAPEEVTATAARAHEDMHDASYHANVGNAE